MIGPANYKILSFNIFDFNKFILLNIIFIMHLILLFYNIWLKYKKYFCINHISFVNSLI